MQPSFLQRYLAAFGHIEGWFSFDAALMFMAYNECLRAHGISGDVLEIGVYHGLSTIAVATLRGTARKFYAVDLFEELGDNEIYGAGASYRKIFEDNMRGFHADLDFLVPIASASDKLAPSGFAPTFSFCHVDGGHSPQETYNDLCFASAILLPGGLLALDDYFNPQHPGVCEGALNFLRDHDSLLTPLAIGYNKVLFQKRPDSPLDLNRDFAHAYPDARHGETVMWDTPVFLFQAQLRDHFDLYASSPDRLVPLGQAGMRALFVPNQPALRSRRGKMLKLPVTVKNVGTETFPGGATTLGLSYHLLASDGQMLQHDNARAYLLEPLRPGAEVKLILMVAAPSTRGHYQLELDLVWENVMWFKDVANPTCIVDLEVR